MMLTTAPVAIAPLRRSCALPRFVPIKSAALLRRTTIRCTAVIKREDFARSVTAAEVLATDVAKPKNSTFSPAIDDAYLKTRTSLLKGVAKAAAVLGVALALVLGRCDVAHAARSAGRAGGFSAPTASRSYGGGRSSYGGYSGGISTYTAPSLSYRSPVVVPGPPVIVPGPSIYYSPAVAGPAVVTGSPHVLDVAIVSIFLVMAASAAVTTLNGSSDGGNLLSGAGRPSLTKVQIGLVSLARGLKNDLDRIAARADTSDARGLHQLLQEVVLAMLRNPKYCVYGDAAQQSTSSVASLESAFNKVSLQERSKFEQETLVNVAGRRRSSTFSNRSGSSKPDELIVVTLLVATSSKVDLPSRINSLSELQQALKALGAIPSDNVMGVEVMWTPQADGDYYTRDEIITDYPNLRQL